MAGIMPVVMAGGSGTRLWPLSKASTPKQFQPLVSEKTMLAETLARVTGDAFIEPAIIGSSQHRSLIEEHLQGGSVLLEPCGRNTGPAALCAALLAAETSPDQLILLLPADHYIADPDGFAEVVLRGQEAAQQGYLVTLGITPTAPEIGYGYIKRGEPLTDGAYTVEKFVEKPDRATAETYLQSEAYAWNAGIFLFQASDLLAEAETYAPVMLEQTKKAFTRAEREGRVLTLPNDDFSAIAGDSIDYAIMEKTSRAAVVSPVNVGWSDIGSWAAVKQLSSTSSSDAFAVDCSNTLIKTSSDAPFVGAIGLEGYVVVATKDSVLIVPADRSQEVKTIVEELKKTGRTDQL